MMALQEQATVQDSQAAALWDEFLARYGRDAVNEVALAWPDRETVSFDFQDLDAFSPDVDPATPSLARWVLSKPVWSLRIAAERVRQMEMPVTDTPLLVVGIRNLPRALRMGPRQLRAEHLGKLVAVQGVVTAASPSLLDVREACYDCKTCANRIRVPQENDGNRLEPVICDGCEKTGPWKYQAEESKHIDAQHLRLQEPPEAVKGGATPEIIGVRVQTDLVHKTGPGSRVIVTGIMGVKYRKQNGKAQVEAEPMLHALHIQLDESEMVDLESPPEEQQLFQDLAATPTVHEELARCLAPSVIGLGEVKLGALLSLVGGPEWARPDGSRVRGRIHMLIAGDPGTAKSKLIGRIGRYVQRCVHVLGVEASRAGLSVAAVKDGPDGRWMLEAGALVLGHKHVVTLDELGHLDPEDQPGLLSSMEDGYVKSDRVVKATLPAETTVLAAMNPIHGRFDRYTPLMEQLGISGPLKSRFDLKWCLLDSVDRDSDNDLADSVLDDKDHRGSLDEKQHYGIALNGDQLRRYIFFARQKQPRITDAALSHLKEYYLRVRDQDKENPAFTARQLEALRRLSGASARLRLSDTIDLADAERAVNLMAASLRSCRIMDDTGRLDGDLLQFGKSKAQHDRIRLVQQAVKDLQRAHVDGYNRGHATEADVVASCLEKGLTAEDVLSSLATLLRNNTIYRRAGGGTYAILTS